MNSLVCKDFLAEIVALGSEKRRICASRLSHLQSKSANYDGATIALQGVLVLGYEEAVDNVGSMISDQLEV